jgi:high-affinity Fe2+/Pb2+ permease
MHVNREQITVGFAATLLLNLCFFAILGRVSLAQYFLVHTFLMAVTCSVFYIVTFTFQDAVANAIAQLIQFVFIVVAGMIVPALASLVFQML